MTVFRDQTGLGTKCILAVTPDGQRLEAQLWFFGHYRYASDSRVHLEMGGDPNMTEIEFLTTQAS